MGADSVARQLERVRLEMATRPEGLLRHIERVIEEAVDLAGRWDVDPRRAELATWGHDLFRAHPPEEQLRLAAEVGVPVTLADEASPVMLHGPIAAAVMQERLRVTDEEALAAVRDHTAGRDEMPLLAKIILIADKVERRKRRRTPVMAEIRRLARRDLDLALLCWADWKWVEERRARWGAYPQHWEARVRWVAEHHADVALPGRSPEPAFESEPAAASATAGGPEDAA